MIKKGIIRQYNVVFYIVSGLMAGFLAGCGTQPIIAAQQVQTSSALPKFQELPEYRIQPGDELDIKFYYNHELNGTQFVRPDGKISLQLIGGVQAAGLTPSELDKAIAERYSRELKRPAVTVVVKTFKSPQIYVGGEVTKEGPIEFTPGMTAIQAVIEAGGFKDTAKPQDVLVIRRDKDDRITPYHTNLDQVYNAPYQADLRLQPYDVVYVAKTFIAKADQFVKQYIEDLLLFRGWGFTFSGILFDVSRQPTTTTITTTPPITATPTTP